MAESLFGRLLASNETVHDIVLTTWRSDHMAASLALSRVVVHLLVTTWESDCVVGSSLLFKL